LAGDEIYLDLDDGGSLRHSVSSEILHLLRLRYTLGERIYYHPTKASASAMISKAVEMSGLPHEALISLRDEELLFVLENAPAGSALGRHKIKNPEVVARLVKMIRSRELYRRAFSITRQAAGPHICTFVDKYYNAANREKRREAEALLAGKIGADPSQVIIYCPDGGMAKKAAMVKVRWPGLPGLQALEVLCQNHFGIEDETARIEIDQLKRKHEMLWRISVFVDPALMDRADDLRAFAQRQFDDIPDSDTKSNQMLKVMRGKRVLEAICNHPAPETLDLPKCFSQYVAGPQEGDSEPPSVAEVRNALPRKATAKVEPESKRDLYAVGVSAAPSPAGGDGGGAVELGIADDVRAKLLAYVKSMPEPQRRKLASQLESLVSEIVGLGPESGRRFFGEIDRRFSLVKDAEDRRVTADAFLGVVRNVLKDLKPSQ
jgi:hypothetical protein